MDALPLSKSQAIINNATSTGYVSNHPVLSIVDSCTNSMQLKQIHAQMLRLGIFFHPYSASRFITSCALSSTTSLDYARRAFDQIPEPNIYTWNTIIRCHASSREDAPLSLQFFYRLLHESSEPPNKYTFPFVIKAASQLSSLRQGQVIHGMVVKSHHHSDIYILNSLIHFYASCECLDICRQIFLNIQDRDVVSWNSMIAAFAQGDLPDQALKLFEDMLAENKFKPNEVTMISVLSACSKKRDLTFGRWIHSFVKRNDIDESLILNNSLLDMYIKCGSLKEAQQLFDKMSVRDSLSWTTLLVGYGKAGEVATARTIFDKMPAQDIAAWNALIAAYEQSGRPKEALDIFQESQKSGAKPDQVTLVCALSACSELCALDMGSWIHAYIKKNQIALNCHLTTSLIDMYSKCGELEKALKVFQSVYEKDVYVWSSMIGGFAMHGLGDRAISFFHQMQEARVKPNAVTFTNILCGCSHAGLVEAGKFYFKQMLELYGVEPMVEHYGCMVDILGRAGLLEEALHLIETMPITPHASVWGALLGACRIHGNVELAEHACKNLLQLEPRNHGAYVLLSNTYAKSGDWEKVSRLRKKMKDEGIKKEPGGSYIEVDGLVHEFLVGDISHPMSVKIYSKLNEISTRIKSVGYIPNKEEILLDIEQDVKEQALNLHSERLAIAFGFINLDPEIPIKIVKNLRMCGDCHTAAKFISSVYGREIFVRDRYRFHHFKDGACSCNDYW